MNILLLLNLGVGEIAFVLIMYLIFFGSKNIPSLAKDLGSSIRKVKDASNSVKKEIKDSILNSDD
ncbi:MAG: twin-arginine translocase TatA/TatE family subunit [Flavobacteriales bacterium]|nr:twin-arginine translocase TatA/TatE family subunit [Flavobacteriales bacterium]|tara:strand:- start:2093 stop:2287 length:195 start_codon:yes stop_codon:yes gene_type:complete